MTDSFTWKNERNDKSRFMKKYAIIALFALLFCSCTVDREKYDRVTVRLINNSEQTLVFSNIDNGGDSRFYPVNSFTLNPGEVYSQSQDHIGSYDPIIISPVSMDIEWDGKSFSLNYDSDIKRNPCKADNWRRYSNQRKYGPGVFFEFEVFQEDLEQWFGNK